MKVKELRIENMKLTTEEICKNALYCIEQTRGTTEMLLEDLEYESVIE